MKNIDDAKRVKIIKGVFKGATGDVEEVKHFGRETHLTVYLDPHPVSGLRCRIDAVKSEVKVVG